jgi:hypothetical protein
VVIQIRGTSGAGKSTLVQRLLREHAGKCLEESFSADDGAEVELPVWHCEGDLCVIGRYANLSGVSRGLGGAVVAGARGEAIVALSGIRSVILAHEGAYEQLHALFLDGGLGCRHAGPEVSASDLGRGSKRGQEPRHGH